MFVENFSDRNFNQLRLVYALLDERRRSLYNSNESFEVCSSTEGGCVGWRRANKAREK